MREMNAYKLKSENLKEWDYLGNLYVEEDNIKICIKKLG
jgi:hypothetical protein